MFKNTPPAVFFNLDFCFSFNLAVNHLHNSLAYANEHASGLSLHERLCSIMPVTGAVDNGSTHRGLLRLMALHFASSL